ncbi:PilZ domain-containing protein [Sphingopyxis sp. PET50]|uniref:PilZ domain-containing protein n=1 Tax=Sphingopyxis sp. PET50 TaxID=2976533 RepID=UPI0021B05502|nr:PilZ domain-containing protein [Sphingopyxis sp. PET50]
MKQQGNFSIKPATRTRGAERAQVKANARFREAGFNPYDAELFDLSSTGFRMNTYARPAIGKHIWVSLPGLQPLEAIVRRADGNEYGCELVVPLHPSVAAHMQTKLRTPLPKN